MNNLKSIFNKMCGWGNLILDLLFPQTEIEKKLSKIDGQTLYKIAIKNNSDNNQKIHSVFSYKDPLIKGAIWSLKYRRNKKMAKILAESISEPFLSVTEDLLLFKNFSKPLLVTIPANKNKLRERGFDQTTLIVKKLITLLPKETIEYQTKILKRLKNKKNQARVKNKKDRFANLKNTLKSSTIVKNRHIIVFDDVYTSGATFKEAERALKQAGAKKIVFFAVAH